MSCIVGIMCGYRHRALLLMSCVAGIVCDCVLLTSCVLMSYVVVGIMCDYVLCYKIIDLYCRNVIELYECHECHKYQSNVWNVKGIS
jgi:hypothetical protein